MKRFIIPLLVTFAFVLSQNNLWSQTATYTWDGGSSGSWSSATNWNPDRDSPASTDKLIINTSALISGLTTETIGQLQITGNATVSLSCTTAVTLTIGGGTDADFQIDAGSSLSVGTNIAFAITGSFANNGWISGVGSATLSLSGTDVIDIGSGSTSTINVQINGNRTVTSAGAAVGGNWEVLAGKTLTVASGVTFRVAGWLSNAGTVNGPGTLQIEEKVGGPGTFSMPVVFSAGGDSPITADMSIVGNVTISSGTNVEDWGGDFTLTVTGTVTNNGTIQNDEGHLTVSIKGSLVNNGSWTNTTTRLTGTGTLSGSENLSTALVVTSTGVVTVTSSLANDGTISVESDGSLGVSTGVTVEANNHVTVYGPVSDDLEGLSKRTRVKVQGRKVSGYGTINGQGNLVFGGNNKAFTNWGIVDAATTFVDHDGDVKTLSGDGSWKSLTIAAECSTTVGGTHTFTGAGTPFVVYGNVTLSAGTVIEYQGASAQTLAPISYKELEIYTSSGVSLPADVSVSGKIETSTGNLNTGAYKLSLDSPSYMEETGGSVVGRVYTVRSCTTAVNQVFGTIGLELLPQSFTPYPAKMKATQGRPALPPIFTVSVTRYTGTAPTKTGVKFVKRYFDLSPNGYDLDATIVFHYRDDELNGATEASLQLFESTDEGATWTARGGTLDAAANKITITGVDTLARWSAGQVISALPPTLSSISPAGGARGTTSNVTLNGSNFLNGGTTVSFSNLGITVNSVTFNSPAQVVANVTISAGAATGRSDVSVTTAGGLGTLTNAFQVQNPEPVLTSISPATGSRGQDLSVFLTGTGFMGSQSTVSFGDGIRIADVSGSSTSLTVSIIISSSATLEARSVVVTNPSPGGGETALSGAFSVVNPSPGISSIAPSSGNRGRSTSVTITGNGFFSGVSSVDFRSDITLDSVVVVSNTQIRGRAVISYAASTGARNISVTNAAPGGGTAALSSAFTISNPVPGVSAIAPSAGVRGKSLTATITGTDFMSGATSLSLGAGITASSINVTSPTQMTATVAIGRDAALGSRGLTVTNATPEGGSGTLSTAFAVENPAPALTSIAPDAGILGQTLGVVLTGTDFFSGASTVDFGPGITVRAVSVDSSGTRLTADITISSEAAVGAKSVTVTNAAPGGGTAALASSFTVGNPAPTLSSVTPAAGGRGQTLSVSLVGTNFISGVTSAEFGLGVAVNSVTVNSPTSLTASITIDPNTIAAARSVSVTNATPGGGNATLSFVFTVVNLAPTITNITPAIGPRGENAAVTIAGANFSVGSTTVDFGAGITVNSTTVTSPAQVTANLAVAAGAALGTRDVVVSNPPPGGGTATLTNGYLVGNPTPVVTAISPVAGFRGQSLTVNVTGTGFFAGATSVSFGPNIDVTSVTVVSATQLTAAVTATTAAATGARNVEVTNPAPGGGTAALTDGFTVTNPMPTIAGITPPNALRGSALSVTVTGTQFLAGVTSLSFGPDITVSGLVVRGLSELQANIAIGNGANAGTKDVTVTNATPGGGTATLSGGFTVTNPAPTLASIAPTTAGRGSLVNVTVVGTQFISGVTTVSFGADMTVTNTSVKSPTEMLVSISISSTATTGSRVVTVGNSSPGGGTATLAAGFSVNLGPATGIEGNLGLVPDEYVLQEAYPNPFNPSTRIRYGIPEDSRVELVIHNMLGNVVAQLIHGERSKGLYELLWHAENLPSGVYLIRLQAESVESTKRFLASRKVVLVK